MGFRAVFMLNSGQFLLMLNMNLKETGDNKRFAAYS